MDFPLRSTSCVFALASQHLSEGRLAAVKMIHQTETKCAQTRASNIFTVAAAATRISYHTPSTAPLSCARFEYRVDSLVRLPSFNSLFVPCVHRGDFRS